MSAYDLPKHLRVVVLNSCFVSTLSALTEYVRTVIFSKNVPSETVDGALMNIFVFDATSKTI